MSSINWAPGIGDPSFMGWLTVVVYFVCAFGSLMLTRRTHVYFDSDLRKQKLFWVLMCLALTLLGFNKQLDLQSLLTELGRFFAHQQGWYEYRRIIQRQFIYSIVIAGFLLFLAILVVFKPIVKKNFFAIFGFSVLIVFVLVRASSFHHMDVFIGTRIFGFKLNWLLELGGLSLILLNIVAIHHKKNLGNSTAGG